MKSSFLNFIKKPPENLLNIKYAAKIPTMLASSNFWKFFINISHIEFNNSVIPKLTNELRLCYEIIFLFSFQ